MKFKGRITGFDPIKYEFTFSLSMVDETIARHFESMVDKDFVFEAKESRRNTDLYDGQRKYWFQLISLVLKHEGHETTADFIDAIHDTWKRTYLPVGYVTLGEKQIIVPASLQKGAENSVTSEQMKRAIEQIKSDYIELLGTNFKEIEQ